MRKVQSYQRAMSYENFMKRALQTSDTSKPGIHMSNMENLMNAEDGNNFSFLPSAEKQLENVKKHLNKAFTKFLKRNLPQEKKEKLQTLKDKIPFSYSSNDLLTIIEDAL